MDPHSAKHKIMLTGTMSLGRDSNPQQAFRVDALHRGQKSLVAFLYHLLHINCLALGLATSAFSAESLPPRRIRERGPRQVGREHVSANKTW